MNRGQVRIIWDQLVGVHAPHVFWLAAGMGGAGDDNQEGYPAEHLLGIGGLVSDFSSQARESDSFLPSRGLDIGVILEPATIMLCSAALILLLMVRTRRARPALAAAAVRS